MNSLLRNLRYDWPVHFILLFTNFLPDNGIFLRFRGWLVSPFLGKCGKDLRLGRGLSFFNPSNIRIGSSVYIAYGCHFLANDLIEIADEVMFGPYVVVVSGNHTRLGASFRYGPTDLAPISIGCGVWIGAHAVITAGSVVGSGTLVAAGAVVAGEFPPNVLAGGVPARVIKAIKASITSMPSTNPLN